LIVDHAGWSAKSEPPKATWPSGLVPTARTTTPTLACNPVWNPANSPANHVGFGEVVAVGAAGRGADGFAVADNGAAGVEGFTGAVIGAT